MISPNAVRNADNCRFCWMCRHLCPIGLKTGKEINTPRAKALLLSLVERGTKFDADMAKAMYECALCGACTNDCVTGFDPSVYIREARSVAAALGLLPPDVGAVLECIEKTGGIYGKKKSPVKSGTSSADSLLYMGEAASEKAPGMVKAVMSLLDKAGISFSVLENEPPSGTFLGDLIGFVEETITQAKICADQINSSSAKTIIVLDPWEAATMIQRYAEWGFPIQAELKTAPVFIEDLVKKGKLKPAQRNGLVSYHDSSRLARDLEIHDAPRFLIESMGYTIQEMFQNKRLAKCCGSSVLKAYAPELALLTTEGRWEDFLRTGAQTLVTACPESYELLSQNIPEGKRLVDIFELLDASCVA